MFSVTLVGMSPRPALDPALLSHLISAQRLEDRRGRRGSGIPAIDQLLGGGGPPAALWQPGGRRAAAWGVGGAARAGLSWSAAAPRGPPGSCTRRWRARWRRARRRRWST